MSIKSYDTIVIGGGQAGLASGYHLQKQGLSYLILESQPEAVGSWPRYYDSLKLFSPAHYSSLPGMEFPGEMGRYPRRDDVITYFKQYVKHFSLSVKTNEHIVQVKREGGRFNIYTASGNTYVSKTIINATGSFHSPYTPRINGIDKFKGKVIHSSVYRNAEPYKKQRVIVVGRGNSAVQIAIELADVSQTSLAVLKPVHFAKQRILGKDIHFWFRLTGLDTFPFWRFGIKSPNPASVIDLDNYKNRIDAFNPDQKTMFTAFYPEGVIWPSGEKEKVDSVIFATGYKSSLFHLEGLGAVHDNGDPIQKGGVSTAVPGLYYVGLYGQRSFASATIRGVGSDAEYVVKQLMRYLKRT
ncbi:NAD(P)/FAD-dependent oxidoreductase [Paenibacillus sp. SC116]|uniref:flavin-containing monooxygenase n=1 Tax=Paenibacillus sp. SC116 TaxID=2968986 RepID=UPI00215B25B4|nr:NAD(P)/FAD-dependent oxidoreductase [Paenibacillus sp. SC116]MCR8842592.1 NAD(P)/FAD-dependent oxidoreductase [Paenibacillus sp. SC116]